MKYLLANGNVILNAHSNPKKMNILIENDRIVNIFNGEKFYEYDQKTDCTGYIIIPGMVQTHVHFCQTLFRGLADDMPLLPWLKHRIWPLEAAHDEGSTYISSMLAATELIASGVTTVCDMESVRFANESARVIEAIGLRAVFGNVLMDNNDTPEELGGMPNAFFKSTTEAIDDALKLYKRWHGTENNRIKFAFMPRGILTSSEELLVEIGKLASELGCLVHTHACETWPESKLVKNKRGLTEIKYLHRVGLTKSKLLLAHCLCIDDEDLDILSKYKVGVSTCPIANLKLGSGIAPLEEMRQKEIILSLGSDGAPCNNNLDIFQEMKFASLLQKGRLVNPVAMSAQDTFNMATLGGARALGLENEIGTIETGKKADLVVLDINRYEAAPAITSVSTLVYAGNPRMVKHVMIDGKWVFYNGYFPLLDIERLHAKAKEAQTRIASKVLN